MKSFVAVLALLPALTLQAQESLPLNGSWQFDLARDDRQIAALEGFFRPGFDASRFHSLPVPSNWALHGYEEPMYGKLTRAGEGFYRHTFQVPVGFEGRRVLLHFGGVWSSAEVWWNGAWIGRHDSGFTSFAFDVSAHVKAGAENLLAVRVRQITRDYSFDANDDWSLGGIFRDVWLESMPADIYLERVETSTHFDSEFRDADLSIRALVAERRNGPGQYRVHVLLTDAEGKKAGEAHVNVAGHPKTGRDSLLKIHVPQAHHWTAETPYLYRVRTSLEVDGRITHSREHQVGFREVSWTGGVLRVNGQPIKLRGVCRHDEHPDVGIATRSEHWRQDIDLMKKGNVNAVRTVHYPPNEGFIELCDQLGIWVIEEVPLGYGGDMAEDPSYAGTVMLRAFETVVRDRNHPSVIVWSVGNENPITALHLAAARYVKGADPDRPTLFPWHPSPVIAGPASKFPGDWMPPEADILAPHYPTAAEALAMTTRANRPVIATEYAHAWAENRFGDLEADFRALTAPPAGAGGTIWMWQDQGLHFNGGTLLIPDGQDGIVRADRTPQRDYQETKAVYAPVSVPISAVEWNPTVKLLRIPVVNEHDFLDLSEVKIHWRLMDGAHELAAGDKRLSTLPHATGWIEIPADKVAAANESYLHVQFLRADGSEITTRAVEVLHPAAPAPAPRLMPLKVHQGATVRVSAGNTTYEFDPASGRLASIVSAGKKIAGEMRFTLWRKLDLFEMMGHKRYGVDTSRFVDLDKYTTQVQEWKLQRSADEVRISIRAAHAAGEHDRFTADYRFTISGRDGSLAVQYSVTPSIQPPWIPEVGMELDVTPEVQSLRWLGLGPMESAPNLRVASILGEWSLPATGETAGGIRSGVRWMETGQGLRIEDCGLFRLVSAGKLRILSAVEGRGAKFRRAEDPQHRLDIVAGKTLMGAFRIRPVKPSLRESGESAASGPVRASR